MSKDIGQVIWELAKSDITFDGRNLMEDFLKKVELDKRLLREKIRDLVLNHIKTKIQPFNTYITIGEDVIGHSPNSEIFEITNDNREELENSSKTNHYMKKSSNGEYYTEIISSDTKYLIDNAIIPLNLEWSLAGKWSSTLIVSWGHWMK